MANNDNPSGALPLTGGARAYLTPSRPGEANPKSGEGERGMSSVAMSARKSKQKRAPKREPPTNEKPAAEEKPAPAEKGDEGEQTIRKGIYLSALIWVEGDWPAARDFAGPAKAAVRKAIEGAFEGEHDGLTLRLKKLEERTDIEENDGEGEQKEEKKFEF
jgi:hypothetical protein